MADRVKLKIRKIDDKTIGLIKTVEKDEIQVSIQDLINDRDNLVKAKQDTQLQMTAVVNNIQLQIDEVNTRIQEAIDLGLSAAGLTLGG